MTAAQIGCPIEPIGGAAHWWRGTGSAPVAVGPGQTPNAPYQQVDPRDTGGMH
jgi:hypothetical protein